MADKRDQSTRFLPGGKGNDRGGRIEGAAGPAGDRPRSPQARVRPLLQREAAGRADEGAKGAGDEAPGRKPQDDRRERGPAPAQQPLGPVLDLRQPLDADGAGPRGRTDAPRLRGVRQAGARGTGGPGGSGEPRPGGGSVAGSPAFVRSGRRRVGPPVASGDALRAGPGDLGVRRGKESGVPREHRGGETEGESGVALNYSPPPAAIRTSARCSSAYAFAYVSSSSVNSFKRASARSLARCARSTSISSARSAVSAITTTRSWFTSANPPPNAILVTALPFRYHRIPMFRIARYWVWPGSTPNSPS